MYPACIQGRGNRLIDRRNLSPVKAGCLVIFGVLSISISPALALIGGNYARD